MRRGMKIPTFTLVNVDDKFIASEPRIVSAMTLKTRRQLKVFFPGIL